MRIDLEPGEWAVSRSLQPLYTFDMLTRLVIVQRTNMQSTDMPDPDVFAAIAMRESGGDPLASNRNTNGSIDRGLWQINSIHEAEFSQFKDFRLACYTPSLNVQMAIEIWRRSGYKAWSTYNSLP